MGKILDDVVECNMGQSVKSSEPERIMKYFRDVDAFEGLTNSIISSLLVDGPTSPFYQALIEPNIGSDYSPATR